MCISEFIRKEFGEMTRSERQVAGFVLGHMNDIVFFTLDELAEKTEVSTTSVLRFCRRLGFDGFKHFQQTVRDELRYSPNLLEKFRRTTNTQLEDSLLAQTVQQGILCIQETFQELSYDSLSDAVEILSSARRVYTFGMRESQALASYTYSRLLTVRGDVFMYHDGYSENIETLLSVTDDDVFVVFLFKRYTEKTLGLLEVLRQRGVRIILVTSPPTDEVARFATILLPCRVDANGIKNSSLAPVCLADYLCNTVAMADPEAAMKRMKESEQLFRQSEILRD